MTKEIIDSFFKDNTPIESSLYVTHKGTRRNKRYYEIRHKKKLKRQAKEINGYPCVSYGLDKYGRYTDNEEDIIYYKKTYKSKHADRYSYYKNAANRKIRREENEVIKDVLSNITSYTFNEFELIDSTFTNSQKGIYKKYYEYAWSIN